ncbi:hypothetical protein F5X96DRAFT_597056 [Biscogniauxia mediterranea]|nr:hypothetical protein F5X96DRAFT_597056 [Biscogniauxia mediterranea]
MKADIIASPRHTSIPALFIYQLTATLAHVQTLRLSGNPLDAVVVIGRPYDKAPPRLVVSVDTADEEESIRVFALDGRSWTPQGCVRGAPPAAAGLSRQELDKLLYTVENLRKTGFDDGPDGGGDEEQGGASTPAPE